MKDGTYGFPKTVELYQEEEPLQFLVGDKDQITTRTELSQSSVSSIEKGAQAGVLKYYIGGTYAGSRKLYAKEDVLKFDYRWCVKFVLKGFLQNALV